MVSIINHHYAKIAGITALEYLIADWIAQATSCKKKVSSLSNIAHETNTSERIVGYAINHLIEHQFLEKKGRTYEVTLQWHCLSKFGVLDSKLKKIKQTKRTPNPHTKLASNVITYLNSVASRSFQANNSLYLEMISQLMRKSPKLEFKQFKAVIDYKYKQWGNNPDMEQYIQPNTLFKTKKFLLYLDEAREAYITEKKELNRPKTNII